MKIKHYNEMMAYLTRPGFNGGGAVSNRTVLPKRKPAAEVKKRKKINYEKIKQYLGKESQELIERELGFAIGGRVNPAQLKQRFMQLVSSIQDADDAEIPGIVAQAKQIRDQIEEINLTLSPDRQIKITAQGIDFDNPLLDAAKIAQTVDTTQEVTGGLTKGIIKDVVPETLTRKNPALKGQPEFIRGDEGTLADPREKEDLKPGRRVGIDPRGNVVQASMRIPNRTDIDFKRTQELYEDVFPEIKTEDEFAEGGSVETPKRGLVDEPGSYAGKKGMKKIDPKISAKNIAAWKKANPNLKLEDMDPSQQSNIKRGKGNFLEIGTGKRGPKSQPLLSKTKVKKIIDGLPEGINLRFSEVGQTKGKLILDATLYKDNKIFFRKTINNPTEQQISDFVKLYEKEYKKAYPNSLGYDEFKKIRLQKKNINLTDAEFAKLLNKKKKLTLRRNEFNSSSVKKYQDKLDIGSEVGVWEKIPIEDIKKTIKTSPGGNVFLKTFKDNEKELRRIAKNIRQRERRVRESGQFYHPPTREGKLWNNLFSASQKGDRIKLSGTFNGKDLSNSNNWPKNWATKGKDGIQAYKKVKFTDTGLDRPTTFTWGDNKTGGVRFKDQIDNVFGKGAFDRYTQAYNTQAIDNNIQVFVNGKKTPFKTAVAENIIIEEFKAQYGKPPPKDYVNAMLSNYQFEEVHHPDGIANNPYKTEPATRSANRKLGILEKQYRVGTLNRSDYITAVRKVSDDYGGIRYKIDDKYYGKKGTRETIFKSSLEQARLTPVKGLKNLLQLDKTQALQLLDKAGIKVTQCFLRKSKADGGRLEGETQQQCITRNIDSELKRAENTKDFSKFKKLRGFLKGTLAVDIPLELMFTMPHLISGDYEAAKRASTLGLFGYGGKALDAFKDNPEVLKFVNTENKTLEFINQYQKLDRLEKEIQDRTKRYEDPGNNPLFQQQLESDINYLTGEYNRIGSEYNNTLERFENKELGYDNLDNKIQARKVVEQALETQQKNLRGGFKPITSLEQAIEQNFSEYPRAVTRARELVPETPEGSLKLFDLGFIKDPRDSYSDIPLKYKPSELGALEAKETREGLKRKQTEGILRSTGIPLAKQIPNLFDFSKSFFRGYAGGGIAKQAGVESGPPPESGPNSQGLAFLMKRGR